MVGMLYNPRAIPRLLQDHRHISASLPHSSKSIKSPVINTNQLLLDMATMEKKDNLGGVVVQNEDMKKPYADEIDISNRDYSGAVLVLSPEEKRLVRKLDWRIMVSTYHSSSTIQAF